MSPEVQGRIRKIRKAAGLTAQEAAERVGMHPVTWSDVERGKNANPTINTLKKVAEALEVNIGDLLEERQGLGAICRDCGAKWLRTDRESFGPEQSKFGTKETYRVRYEEYVCPGCGKTEWGAIGTDEGA